MADELDKLIDEWGEDNVRKAFWLQNHIKNEGLDGIFFMHDEGKGKSAESEMKRIGPALTKKTIEGEMKSSY